MIVQPRHANLSCLHCFDLLEIYVSATASIGFYKYSSLYQLHSLFSFFLFCNVPSLHCSLAWWCFATWCRRRMWTVSYHARSRKSAADSALCSRSSSMSSRKECRQSSRYSCSSCWHIVSGPKHGIHHLSLIVPRSSVCFLSFLFSILFVLFSGFSALNLLSLSYPLFSAT